MQYICGIYGFAITKPFELSNAKIEPVGISSQESHDRARDELAYRLTATIRAESFKPLFLFNLEAVLSFVERLDVLVTQPIPLGNSESCHTFPETALHRSRRSGGGATLPEDTWSGSSRAVFVDRAMNCLEDQAFCEATTFNTLFFKCVESFRQRRPFIEITWFLLYSGLEAHARAVQSDLASRNSSEPITRLLLSYGLNVFQDKPSDLPRSVSSYMHLRNALFHHGAREKVVNVNGTTVTLEMTRFLFNLEQLVALVILKAVKFDDGHINWDSWIDRMPFK